MISCAIGIDPGICKVAVIEAGQEIISETRPDIRRSDAYCVERTPQRRQVALRNMRQNEILLMADVDLAERITVGKIGNRIYLLGGGVARRPAFRLERQCGRWHSPAAL